MFSRDIQINKVIVVTGRTDMRRGIDSLVSTVYLNYNLDPIDKGTLFLF
jgi:transposase